MRFKEATLRGEIEHRFTCFAAVGQIDVAPVIAFVDEAVAWVKERGGHVERRNNFVIKLYGDDLALEFKLRWC